MSPACLLLLVGLGPDAGANLPLPWLPTTKRMDISDQAAYGLARSGESYTYETPHFQARVGRDGVVSFKDKHGSASVVFPLFSFIGTPPRGPTLESTLRGYFDKRRRPAPAPRRDPEPNGDCSPSFPCDWQAPPATMVVQGSFALTDEIMRKLGEEPYAFEKARFLSATFEFRIRLAMEARKDDVRQAFEDLPARLDELWGDERYSPRERRRILYELWYETERSPEGERAAASIRAFIFRRLPCGTPDGFTRAELEAFAKAHPDRLLVQPDVCR